MKSLMRNSKEEYIPKPVVADEVPLRITVWNMPVGIGVDIAL